MAILVFLFPFCFFLWEKRLRQQLTCEGILFVPEQRLLNFLEQRRRQSKNCKDY
eukprot:NODE_9010_length_234_cov_1.378378_g8395_i0.p2 GENE.NODE_9010_length_234_cov_1.378378_g8395_i0~~NODE_9010_length_234_cov_1.378378_g8395_i0.p2  ORF type:complete len:54 (-),score=4.32 NODE_9010_length_234_cov_1.378378_g8395_i0:3-164(-)